MTIKEILNRGGIDYNEVIGTPFIAFSCPFGNHLMNMGLKQADFWINIGTGVGECRHEGCGIRIEIPLEH